MQTEALEAADLFYWHLLTSEVAVCLGCFIHHVMRSRKREWSNLEAGVFGAAGYMIYRSWPRQSTRFNSMSTLHRLKVSMGCAVLCRDVNARKIKQSLIPESLPSPD